MNSAYDWDSPIRSPSFIEGYVTYYQREFTKGKVCIIDVREIKKFADKESEFETYAWTILPVFTYEGYVNSGVYQMPLFRGEVDENVLTRVNNSTDPWKEFMDISKEIDFDTGKPTIQYLRPASVIVRLIDGQREVRNSYQRNILRIFLVFHKKLKKSFFLHFSVFGHFETFFNSVGPLLDSI